MRQILAGKDEFVAKWVASKIPVFEFGSSPYTAIGLMNEAGLLAGVIYQNYTRRDIQMHVAALPGKRWLSKQFLGEAFRYPFETLGVTRITAPIPSKNSASESFCRHLGFTFEGRLREMLPGEDLLVYGMLREECRYLEVGRFNGKSNRFHSFPERTAAAL